MSRLLLVLPLTAYQTAEGVFIDGQARNGLRLWLQNFEQLTLACPTVVETTVPDGFLKIDDDRVSFVLLPQAYTPHRFLTVLPDTIRKLSSLIKTADFLHFAIGGLFGDWGSVAAFIAKHQKRRFAVWTDRVESKVMAFQAKTKPALKRPYYFGVSIATRIYERQVIRQAKLGLFHGMDCFDAYSSFSTHPKLVHNIHLGRDEIITDAEISERASYSGPLRVAYAGRAAREKGIFDWIDALSLLSIPFTATWFGDGPDIEAARKKANVMPVAFSGAIAHADLMKKLRQFDCFVFCHLTEESPRNLIEALMCGLPIVGYRSSYAANLIDEHGGGMLTEQTAVALSKTIEQFAQQKDDLTPKARRDGGRFDAESVFKHRSDLIKAYLIDTGS